MTYTCFVSISFFISGKAIEVHVAMAHSITTPLLFLSTTQIWNSSVWGFAYIASYGQLSLDGSAPSLRIAKRARLLTALCWKPVLYTAKNINYKDLRPKREVSLLQFIQYSISSSVLWKVFIFNNVLFPYRCNNSTAEIKAGYFHFFIYLVVILCYQSSAISNFLHFCFLGFLNRFVR